jgi:hypothetical protein
LASQPGRADLHGLRKAFAKEFSGVTRLPIWRI